MGCALCIFVNTSLILRVSEGTYSHYTFTYFYHVKNSRNAIFPRLENFQAFFMEDPQRQALIETGQEGSS